MVIGTCSLCGGAVQIPDNWLAMRPPIPRCAACGATKKQPFGGVIDMEPPKPSRNVFMAPDGKTLVEFGDLSLDVREDGDRLTFRGTMPVIVKRTE